MLHSAAFSGTNSSTSIAGFWLGGLWNGLIGIKDEVKASKEKEVHLHTKSQWIVIKCYVVLQTNLSIAHM